MVTNVFLRSRAVIRLMSHANRLVAAMLSSGSAASSSKNAQIPAALTAPCSTQAIPAGSATSSSKTRFKISSSAMRDSRMSRGRIGMASSSSLSFASKSCAFAAKTLPINISANARMIYIVQ